MNKEQIRKNKKVSMINRVINKPNNYSVIILLNQLNLSNKKLAAILKVNTQDLHAFKLNEIKSIKNMGYQLTKNEKAIKDRLLTLALRLKIHKYMSDDPDFQIKLINDQM